jgi:hypothetical protein
MIPKVALFALGFTIMTGMLALADGSKSQSANGPKGHQMKMDRCPYYPSPVVCRDGLGAHTISARPTPPRDAFARYRSAF